MTKYINGSVVTANFKISVGRCQPAILNFLDLDFSFAQPDAPGCLFSPISGIAFHSNFHRLPPMAGNDYSLKESYIIMPIFLKSKAVFTQSSQNSIGCYSLSVNCYWFFNFKIKCFFSTGCCPNLFEHSLKRFLLINLGEVKEKRFQLFEPEARVLEWLRRTFGVKCFFVSKNMLFVSVP